jgi:hypothetical protein
MMLNGTNLTILGFMMGGFGSSRNVSLNTVTLSLLVLSSSFVSGNDRGPDNSAQVSEISVGSWQADSTLVDNLIDGSGLERIREGWGHTNDAYRDRGLEIGTMWSSGAIDGKADEKPELLFDFGNSIPVGSIHFWNYNQSGWNGQGVKDVEFWASDDGVQFRLVGRSTLAPGSAIPDDIGSLVDLYRGSGTGTHSGRGTIDFHVLEQSFECQLDRQSHESDTHPSRHW